MNSPGFLVKAAKDELGKNFLPDRIGICLLLFLAFAVGFSRGLSNTAFALLFFVFLIRFIPWPQAKTIVSSLPKPYLWSQLIFALTWSLLIVFSPDSLPGAKFLITVLYLMAVFPITVLWAQEERWRSLILPLLATGFITASLIASWQAWPGMDCVRAKAHLGIMEYAGVLGLLTFFWAALALLAWQEKKRLLTGLYSLAFFAGLWGQTLNCTRISILSTLMGAIIFFILNIRRFSWRFLLITLILLSLFFFYSSKQPEMAARLASITNIKTDSSNAMRLSMWSYGWEIFKEHPVSGIGIKNLPPLLLVFDGNAISLTPLDKQYDENNVSPGAVPKGAQVHYHVHNVFLEIMVEGGVIGLAAYLALYLPFIFLALGRLRSPDIRIRSWAVLTLVLIGQYFTHSMTDQIFSLKPLMYVFWMLMGLAYLQMQPGGHSSSATPTEIQAVKKQSL